MHRPSASTGAALFAAAMIALLPALSARATLLTPAPGYASFDVLGGLYATAFDVFDDGGTVKAYTWSNGQLELYNVATGDFIAAFGAPTGYSGFNSFLAFSGSGVWVGFTSTGNVDDRIYEVTDLGGSPTWNLRSSLKANQGMAFRGSEAFVSASDSGNFSDPNRLYRLAVTGSTYSAQLFAEVGGNPAGLAFDGTGNLLYAAYDGFGVPGSLLRYSASQVDSFLADPGAWAALDRNDAELLSDLPRGGSDLHVDTAGQVFVGTNGFTNEILRWTGTPGAGDHYTLVASDTNSGAWLTAVAGVGAVGAGGALYAGSFGTYSSAGEIGQVVPEPSGALLLGLGLAALAVRLPSRRHGR